MKRGPGVPIFYGNARAEKAFLEIIDQVRQASSIIEIASQYTTLKRRGRKWVGLCPFHTEKTPSFTVDEEKLLYHCFGCGVGGDIFSLVMERENLTFPEALKSLAERYRVPLPAHQRVRPEVLKLEAKLFKINELALGFFKKNLFGTAEGKKALEYLKKRGLADETVQTLKIGYALNSWTALLDFFKSQDVPVPLLEKSGLVLAGSRAGEYRDRFRGRVIFPIFSLTGRVVAFGGRTIVEAEPKYLNSPETPVYSKGKLLYGLNFTKDAIREAGAAVLVEGYTDFSALYQAGVRNVVASLGTALTAWQVGQAQRFASRLIVNYDGDSAGRAAAARAVPLGFEKGLHVEVLVLPDDLDPDAFLRKHGRDKYQALLKKAVPGLDFLIDSLVKGVRMSVPEEKGRVARAVVKEIEKVPDLIARSDYLQRASERLGVGEELLRRIVEPRAPDKGREDARHFCPAEKRLFQILMEDPSVASLVFEMYLRQVVGRFVRMQDGMPKPQRAWLYLPKDPVLAHYARQIKAERDHVLEDIMPAGQRDLFGRVTVSTNEYMPLMAVARVDSVIGEEDARGESLTAISTEPPVSLHEQKQDLRELHRLLVSAVARAGGIDHRRLNAELIARTGSRVDQATVEQLRKRIQLLERWKDQGYDGKR